jgi:fumarate reductase subunit C
MMREFTAVFVAAYCVLLLLIVWHIKKSSHPGVAYDDIMARLQTPWSVAFHFLALLAAMFHTVTWFALVPKVLVVRLGEDKLPPILLVLAHWALWLVVSATIVCVLFVWR